MGDEDTRILAMAIPLLLLSMLISLIPAAPLPAAHPAILRSSHVHKISTANATVDVPVAYLGEYLTSALSSTLSTVRRCGGRRAPGCVGGGGRSSPSPPPPPPPPPPPTNPPESLTEAREPVHRPVQGGRGGWMGHINRNLRCGLDFWSQRDVQCQSQMQSGLVRNRDLVSRHSSLRSPSPRRVAITSCLLQWDGVCKSGCGIRLHDTSAECNSREGDDHKCGST